MLDEHVLEKAYRAIIDYPKSVTEVLWRLKDYFGDGVNYELIKFPKDPLNQHHKYGLTVKTEHDGFFVNINKALYDHIRRTTPGEWRR